MVSVHTNLSNIRNIILDNTEKQKLKCFWWSSLNPAAAAEPTFPDFEQCCLYELITEYTSVLSTEPANTFVWINKHARTHKQISRCSKFQEDNLTKRTVVLWTPFVLYLDNSLEFGLFDSPIIVDIKNTKDLPGGVEGCKYKTTHWKIMPSRVLWTKELIKGNWLGIVLFIVHQPVSYTHLTLPTIYSV